MTAKSRKFETRLTVSLTGKDYNALNTLADKDEVSASWLVRRAVEEYLRHRQQEIVLAGDSETPQAESKVIRRSIRNSQRRESGC